MEKLIREILSKCCIKGEDSSNDVKNTIVCCVTAKELNIDFREDDEDESSSSSSESEQKEEKRSEQDRKSTASSILQLWKRRSIAKQSKEAPSNSKPSNSNAETCERVSE